MATCFIINVFHCLNRKCRYYSMNLLVVVLCITFDDPVALFVRLFTTLVMGDRMSRIIDILRFWALCRAIIVSQLMILLNGYLETARKHCKISPKTLCIYIDAFLTRSNHINIQSTYFCR